MVVAENEMFFMLQRLISGELIMIRTEGEFGYSFHVGYSDAHIIAFCPQYFPTPYLRDLFMDRLWRRLMVVYNGGWSMLIRRWITPVACLVPAFYNIPCWERDGGIRHGMGIQFLPLIDRIEAIQVWAVQRDSHGIQ